MQLELQLEVEDEQLFRPLKNIYMAWVGFLIRVVAGRKDSLLDFQVDK